MKFRCPKCRGGNLRMWEEFIVSDYIEIESGGVVWRGRDEMAQSLNSFSAECACGHKWKPRKSTGAVAVEDAAKLI
jgi:hypothetical protein